MSSTVADYCDMRKEWGVQTASSACFSGVGWKTERKTAKTKKVVLCVKLYHANNSELKAAKLYFKFIARIFPWFSWFTVKKNNLHLDKADFVCGSRLPSTKTGTTTWHHWVRFQRPAALAPLFLARYANASEFASGAVKALSKSRKFKAGKMDDSEIWELITKELLGNPDKYAGGHGIYSTYDFDVVEDGKYGKMKFKTFDELKECAKSIASGKVQPKSVYKIFNK